MRIAVPALQGAFIEHERMFASLGADVFELRQEKDLQNAFDALVLPGGESTVQGRLLCETGAFEPLRRRIEAGCPCSAPAPVCFCSRVSSITTTAPILQ